MKNIIFIILAIFLFSCENEEVKPNQTVSNLDTFAVFKLWGDVNKRVPIFYWSDGEIWRDTVDFKAGYTFDNALYYYMPIKGAKVDKPFNFNINKTTSCAGDSSSFDRTSKGYEIGECGSIIK
jgi:hypothetical protein